MKVFVSGKGEVTLSQRDFVAQGGQASVYQRNGVAYKIYSDQKSVIPDAKFGALRTIDDPNVVKPDDALVDPKSKAPIGYTMRFVNDTFALCQVFTKAFRDRHNVTDHHVVELVSKLRAHIANVHRAGILIVDLNELNILVDQSISDLYLIDVDSYQAPGFPAEVIMPSVRDWSVKPSQFSVLSDWFSYAVLACQMLVGIHPYRGRHDNSASVPPDQRLEHRMRRNVSIFDPTVCIPKVCYPLDAIPATFREWLKAVLQDGKRLPPPDPKGGPALIVTKTAPQFTSGSLLITELDAYNGDILDYAESGSHVLVLTTTGLYFDGRRQPYELREGTTLVGFTAKMNQPIAVSLHAGELSVVDVQTNHVAKTRIAASEVARSGERFYVRSGTQVHELDVHDISVSSVFAALSGSSRLVFTQLVADVLESASRLFEGMVHQSMLGSAFVSLFPRSRAGYQVRVPELDTYRIIEAKFEGGVMMVIGARGGQYDRLIFRFDEDFAEYDVRRIENVSPTGLNFITLHSGVCVSVTEDETIEIFPTKKGATGRRDIHDEAIGNDMKLVSIGGRVGFCRQSKTYQAVAK